MWVVAPRYEQVYKKKKQMVDLLAILFALCPNLYTPATNPVGKIVQGQCGDQVGLMLSDDHAGAQDAFDALYRRAAPKFVTAEAPDFGAPDAGPREDRRNAALAQQKDAFLARVAEWLPLRDGQAFLKLYTAIGVPKLAELNQCAPEAMRATLAQLKEKTRQLQHPGGAAPPAEGVWRHIPGTAFELDGDTVTVERAEERTKFGEFFVQHANLMEKMGRDVLAAGKHSRGRRNRGGGGKRDGGGGGGGGASAAARKAKHAAKGGR